MESSTKSTNRMSKKQVAIENIKLELGVQLARRPDPAKRRRLLDTQIVSQTTTLLEKCHAYMEWLPGLTWDIYTYAVVLCAADAQSWQHAVIPGPSVCDAMTSGLLQGWRLGGGSLRCGWCQCAQWV